MSRRRPILFLAILLVPLASALVITPPLGAGAKASGPYATAWIAGHKYRSRLLIGGEPGPDGKINRYAALQIELDPGWKTYWRQPGSSGGIPPQIDWSGSTNLRAAKLAYPAPLRMRDATGDTVGYKTSVTFPVALHLKDPRAQTTVSLRAFFGVCESICIPAQASFKVTINEARFRVMPFQLAKALRSVPVDAALAAVEKTRPMVGSVQPTTPPDGAVAAYLLRVDAPKGVSKVDVFAETTQGSGLAMTDRVEAGRGKVIFRLPVRNKLTLQNLQATGVRLTLVSSAGAVSQHIALPD